MTTQKVISITRLYPELPDCRGGSTSETQSKQDGTNYLHCGIQSGKFDLQQLKTEKEKKKKKAHKKKTERRKACSCSKMLSSTGM